MIMGEPADGITRIMSNESLTNKILCDTETANVIKDYCTMKDTTDKEHTYHIITDINMSKVQSIPNQNKQYTPTDSVQNEGYEKT